MSGKVTKKFNPNEHLRTFERRQRQLDGSYKTVGIDYLDVKWRLVWFRQEHPNGSIQTDLLSAPGVTPAVVRATVTLENGVTSTGFGQCGEDDWSDWLEKAETRAIGRALALLGFGTQFCEEFDEIITDAPVESKRQRKSTPVQSEGAPPASNGNRASQDPMTPNQRKYIEALARDAGMDDAELEFVTEERFGHGLSDLLKSEASSLINGLQELKEERLRDTANAA